MKAHDVRRLICVSSRASRNEDPNIPFFYRRIISPLFMTDLYRDMVRMEGIVRASGLDWILVRPAHLLDVPPHRTYRLEDGTNPRGGRQTSRQDLADFCVAQLTTDTWLHREPTMAT